MAQHYNTRITDVGNLIFYLDAVNLKSYSGSGSIWYDVSGNRNHFTLFNSPTYTNNGTTGTYLTFNGTNQYARSTEAINFNQYSAITIEIGFRSTSTLTQVLYETTGTGGSTTTGGISLLMNANNTSTSIANGYLSFWQGYGPRIFGFVSGINTNFNAITEIFVKGTDSTGRITYVNNSSTVYFTNSGVGTSTNTTTAGLSFSNTWTYIASRDGARNFFNGDIAWVRAWGTKINNISLEQNFNSIVSRQPNSYNNFTILRTDPASGGGASGVVLISSIFDGLCAYLQGFLSEFQNPSFYSYTLDGTTIAITDGSNDMYDTGNFTYPWLLSGTVLATNHNVSQDATNNIDYSQSTGSVTRDTNFVYRTLGYGTSPDRRPLTVLGYRTAANTPIGFQKGGDLGADGGGTLNSGFVYNGVTVNTFTVYAFRRITYNASDPSVCDLYMLIGHPNFSSVFGTVTGYSDSSGTNSNGGYLYAANSSNVIAVATLLSKSGGVEVTAAECQTVVQNFTSRMKTHLGF